MNHYSDLADLLNLHLARADDRSAAWLARRLQVHPSTVSKWLNGSSRPSSPEKLIRIADILNIHEQAERQKLFWAAGYGYYQREPQKLPTLYGATRTVPDVGQLQNAEMVTPHNSLGKAVRHVQQGWYNWWEDQRVFLHNWLQHHGKILLCCGILVLLVTLLRHYLGG